MQIHLHKQLHTAPPAASPHVLDVASMFGLGLDQDHTLELIPPIALTLAPHQLLFITGPSGSGKSTLLRLLADAIHAHPPEPPRILWLHDLPPLPNLPLVDALPSQTTCGTDEQHGDPQDLADRLCLLSLAGLNDAFTLLRTPAQLSDGQRFRLQLAHAFALLAQTAGAEDGMPRAVLLIDEFAAALDRDTAFAVAANLRRWVRRAPVTCAVATTHDDLLEALDPDVLIYKPLGPGLELCERGKSHKASHKPY